MSLEWTRETPQTSGYYWFVNVDDFYKPEIKPQVVRVRDVYENVPTHVGPPSFYLDSLLRAQSDPLEQYRGCWYGPITMPEVSHCPGW